MLHRFNPLHPDENALPPEQVRITTLNVEPWPEGHKVRVLMEITPFQKPPNIEAIIYDDDGNEITSAHIIENIDFRLVFTMHLRAKPPKPQLHLVARVHYLELGVVHEQKTTFLLKENEED